MPSMWVSTTSPSLRNHRGVRAPPTPAGVPVKITSPGCRTATAESFSINTGMLKMSLLVRLFCTVSPQIVHEMELGERRRLRGIVQSGLVGAVAGIEADGEHLGRRLRRPAELVGHDRLSLGLERRVCRGMPRAELGPALALPMRGRPDAIAADLGHVEHPVPVGRHEHCSS
jgi:hypothetical protein